MYVESILEFSGVWSVGESAGGTREKIAFPESDSQILLQAVYATAKEEKEEGTKEEKEEGAKNGAKEFLKELFL